MNVYEVKKWIADQPIKWRLLYGYLTTFLFLVIVGNSILYFFVRSSISQTIEAELSNSLHFAQNLIQSAAQSTITNHLKLIVEKNIDIIIGIYHQNIPELEAKKLAGKILASQTVGNSGKLYAINSNGVVQVHPDDAKVGENLNVSDYIKRQTKLKHGYLEYKQEDPIEKTTFSEALYMSYFGPWDWIVTASLKKSEFKSLVQFESLGKTLLTRKFGKSGFTYVIDSKGNVVIHPSLAGENIYNLESMDGRRFIQEMCETKNGKIIYSWINPGEKQTRKRVVHYGYIPELDWIIATSGYLDEFYKPLSTLRLLIFTTLAFIAITVLVMTWQISDSITKPIKYLMAGLRAASSGDFSTRLKPKSADELGQLENLFNTFIAQLQESNARLHASEKGYRSIFENSVEGICQFDLVGNILKVNPSFVAMVGYSSSQELLKDRANLQRDFIVIKELWKKLLEHIISERAVKGMELQIYKKSGKVFWCLLNARGIYEEDSDKLVMIEGFLSDINAKRIAQEGQKKMMEDLEVMVAERTIELSNRVSELEQRDQLNRHMGEMADMLQSCRSTKETFPVINQYLKIFFPHDACTLYLHDIARQMIDQVVPPPSRNTSIMSMTNDSCWALRQGKNYLYNNTMDRELTCEHVEEVPNGYICIPLIAHGVTMGLLHIVFQESEDDSPEHNESKRLIERKTRVISRLAEHLSLALANLSLQEKLKLKSIQDSLTGLANRRHMEEILQRQFFRMHRHQTPCSVIMLDVDHFKQFNDTYGHDIGDSVLKELGGYLKKNTRGEDLACRYGGEEFIVILVDTDIVSASKKAERMREEIAEKISIHHLADTLKITVSMGVATCPTHGQNTAELIKAADTALYLAKEGGRNRVEVAEVNSEVN
jgi:diguanylate cyclase (GGDEF)-like protein/PAS domain S-box-containing protein